MAYGSWLRRSCVALLMLWVGGCAVQPPQPVPPPAPKAPPPVVPSTPSLPPGGATPVPKTYSGSYPERLEAASRDALAGTAARVVRNGNTVKLVIPAGTAFASNSAQLQSRAHAMLDSVMRLCREYNKTAIVIKGFTDSTGSFEHNQQLSEQRAQVVSAHLRREIAPNRIKAAGYGPRYPIADNKTDAGRMQNRRIEIDMVTTP